VLVKTKRETSISQSYAKEMFSNDFRIKMILDRGMSQIRNFGKENRLKVTCLPSGQEIEVSQHHNATIAMISLNNDGGFKF
jgi:hypothetical protein